MKLLKVEEVEVSELIEFLRKGGIIIYPTETLYGIGVKYDNRALLQRVFELKRRPAEKVFPLIVNLNHLDMVAKSIPEVAKKLMEQYWPGPLTLLLPAKEELPNQIVSNNKIAVRMPGESFALRLIKKSPFPITATSANISEAPPASEPAKVFEYFGEVNENLLLIDGGKLPGKPSTIIDTTVSPPLLVRAGAIEIDLSSYG